MGGSRDRFHWGLVRFVWVDGDGMRIMCRRDDDHGDGSCEPFFKFMYALRDAMCYSHILFVFYSSGEKRTTKSRDCIRKKNEAHGEKRTWKKGGCMVRYTQRIESKAKQNDRQHCSRASEL